MPAKDTIPFTDMLRSPVQLLAHGFGAGLSPWAPGTFGTLPAILIWIPLSFVWWPLYLLIVALMAVAGVWICEVASKHTGQHDHGSIVWDEIVGFLVAVFLVPLSLGAVVIGFLVFRLFDILKPWPISRVDKSVHGGMGIMLDDVLAGVATCVVLHGLHLSFPGWF